MLAGTTPTPPHPKIAKTARSTVASVPFDWVADAAAYLAGQRALGTYILALEVTDESTSLREYRLPPEAGKGLILVAGAEDRGVPAELLALCDHSVHLPMYGSNTSMNLAVAVGAAVYLLLMQLE